MILDRKTFKIKKGRMEEAVALTKTEIERINRTDTVRVSRSATGRGDVLATEWEFENVTEHAEFWAEYFHTPEAAVFLKKWNKLNKSWTQHLWVVE